VFLLLDHLGGIHTMLQTLAHGGTLVISEERKPAAVARAFGYPLEFDPNDAFCLAVAGHLQPICGRT